jgi:transcriptional regulator with XRE-family HTH domain
MAGKSSEERSHAAILSAALKMIRKDRGLRPSEVARGMNMPLRSYEHFEAGHGRITYDRIAQFAEVTNSDAIAIWAAIPMECPEFALRCADNKLMTIATIALSELNEDLGEDLTYLEAATLIGGFTRVAKDLAEHVRKRDTFAEAWLQERKSKIKGVASVSQLDWRRRIAENRS